MPKGQANKTIGQPQPRDRIQIAGSRNAKSAVDRGFSLKIATIHAGRIQFAVNRNAKAGGVPKASATKARQGVLKGQAIQRAAKA